MVFVKTWDENVPAGSEAILTGDDRIREFKYAIRERLNVDHNFKATEGADALIGAHNQVSFIDQVTDVAAKVGATILYGKTITGKIEIFLILSDSTIVQLTVNGKLNAAAFTALSTIPSGAGIIPIANLASGTPTGTKFIRDDGSLQLPTFQTAATQAEMEAGSSLTVPVTPGRAQFHPGVSKAWIRFDGTGTPAINASYNVTSITDNGVGDYTLNWTVSFSSATAYCISGIGGDSGAASGARIVAVTYSTGSCRIMTVNTANANTDYAFVNLMAFGDQ